MYPREILGKKEYGVGLWKFLISIYNLLMFENKTGAKFPNRGLYYRKGGIFLSIRTQFSVYNSPQA